MDPPPRLLEISSPESSTSSKYTNSSKEKDMLMKLSDPPPPPLPPLVVTPKASHQQQQPVRLPQLPPHKNCPQHGHHHKLLPRLAGDGGKKKKSVSFATITVHYHCIVLGDSPSVSVGPPIALSWETVCPLEDNCAPNVALLPWCIPLDLYETARPTRRKLEQMRIPASYRILALKRAGVTETEIQQCVQAIQRLQVQAKHSRELLNERKQRKRTPALLHWLGGVVANSNSSSNNNNEYKRPRVKQPA